MPISFFIAETGEFYCAMGEKVDNETFDWLARNGIELGRKTSFKIKKESPAFGSISEAEPWLTENWFPGARWIKSASDEDPSPTTEHYEDCARLAHEANEIVAGSKLDRLLSAESDHSYLCKVGVWYWSLGHRRLALMAYRRSLEIQPEAATYFNLAVCHDDLGNRAEVMSAMEEFYKWVDSDEEREGAEEMLREQGKAHLIKK
jgi:hypothetical protein